MNDYWNDPPEEPEVPECCGYEMAVNDDGSLHCLECDLHIEQGQQPDPILKQHQDFELPDNIMPTECPHGNAWSECDSCFYESDLAYDAARERRGR